MQTDRKVEFYRHNIGDAEKAQILAALDSLVLTTGKSVRDAEVALAEYLGIRHVVALDSCTAALHLALLANDILPGDEVIVPAMTFIATANAVVMAGAIPVFADVDPRTGCITVDTIRRRITKRTRAMIPVHLYGLLCDMKAIRMLADQHGLAVIEDSAHCLEARRESVRPGSDSKAACFSFYATKALTCGEGGALATNDADVALRVRGLALHGMSSSAYERHSKRYAHWDMDDFGYKYNLDNIRAALLLPQIARLDGWCARRREVAQRYEQRLSNCDAIEYPNVDNEQCSARHLFTIWVDADRRDAVLAELQEHGIGVAVNYRPVHLMRYYRRRFGFQEGDLPVAESIGARTISLPLYPRLTDEEVDYVADVVCRIAERSKRPHRTQILERV